MAVRVHDVAKAAPPSSPATPGANTHDSPGSLFLVASRSWFPSGEGIWRRRRLRGAFEQKALPMDTITLTGVHANGTHGVLAFEHERPQTFVVDVTLHLDLAAAGQSDDLNDTIDYGRVAKDIVAVIEGPHVD